MIMAVIWKPVRGYEDRYLISNNGKVKSILKNRNILLRTDFYGYTNVELSKNGIKKRVKLHRILCEAFLDNPKNYKVINHIDGNKSNNDLSNLHWCTHSQNTFHAIDTGLSKRKLSFEKATEIRKLFKNGMNLKELSIKFNVSKTTICLVVNNKYWVRTKVEIKNEDGIWMINGKRINDRSEKLTNAEQNLLNEFFKEYKQTL